MRSSSRSLRPYRPEIGTLLKLAMPIIFGQLGIMLMGVADVIQVGHMAHGAKFALDAAGIGNSVWITIAIFGFNAQYVVAPLIAKAKEEGDFLQITRLLRATLRVALLMSVGCVGILVMLAFNFQWFGQSAEVSVRAVPFLLIFTLSTVPIFLFTALRQLSDGLGHTRVAMVITLLAVGMNVVLNYFLIYGNGGFPEMGLLGSGMATLVSRCFMALAMWGYLRFGKDFRSYFLRPLNPDNQPSFNLRPLVLKLLKLGIPSGFQGFFEIAVFALAAVMMGWLGENQLAAHLIAINPASVTYMMVTGLATAGGIRVGTGLGQRDRAAVLRSGTVALGLGTAFMAVCCLLFLTAGEAIAGLYIRDPEVATIAAGLLFIAGFFQLFDGIQAVSLGLLRGLADVNLPTIVTLFAYWVVGLPIGALLTFRFGWGATGLWIGLTAGLMAAAVLLSWRFFNIAQRLRFRSAENPTGHENAGGSTTVVLPN
ncbi:MAG: MATE family efflux transporter [Sphingobacteriaceae bacterium]|nr:MATE family efflux transporter [Cytophagaceae bacterium]